MEHLQRRAADLIQASLSQNTKLAYTNALNNFNKFRTSHSLQNLWPVPAEHLEYYIADLYDKGYSAKSASTFISAISYFHKIHGIDDASSQFRCKKVLEGFRRMTPSKDRRLPILLGMLEQIYKKLGHVCSSPYEATLFRAAYTLAFFGLFRVSEIAWSSLLDPDRPLQIDDVKFIKKGESIKTVNISLRKSKTNHVNKNELVQIFPIKSVVCPVQALQCYLGVRHKGLGILLCHQDRSPLTRYQFGAVLSKTLQALRIDTSGYRSHSFRIGAASWLASQGTPYDTIKKMGRWSSNSFMTYIRI